jgi:GDP-L-fucose synthase
MSPQSWSGKRVVVTGGAGFIGSYVVENLVECRGVRPQDVIVPRSREHDLRRLDACREILRGADVAIHLAAVTGGINFSRSHSASQYFDSSLIDMNVFEAARLERVSKIVAIGNLFAYAPGAPVPLREENLFDGVPTDAHRGVGWMKRNLAILADLYHRQYELDACVVYSANAYGPRDSIDLQHSHVIPATIMKCLRESKLVVWGDGSPTRDFLFAGDVAEGLLLAAERLRGPQFVNISSGTEVSIRDLVTTIARLAGFGGSIEFDTSKAGGDARRCASSEQAAQLIGFRATVGLEEGLRRTVEWLKGKLQKA